MEDAALVYIAHKNIADWY